MCKKLLIAAIVGVVAISAIKGTKLFSYAKQEVADVGDWMDSQVPIEKKIQRLRKDVKQLDKDIDKAQTAYVTEVVDVDRLSKKVAEWKSGVESDHDKIVAMGEKIKTANKDAKLKVTYGKHENVSTDKALQLLQDDTKQLVARKATLGSMEQTLSARVRIKDALQKQLDGLRRNKQEMTVAIDKLEAEYKVLQYEQIESKYQMDDTRLAGVKQSLSDLQREVDIQRQQLKLAPTIAEDGPPANGLSVDEILGQLNEKKGESKDQ
jgi:chromosome segregation ATPase